MPACHCGINATADAGAATLLRHAFWRQRMPKENRFMSIARICACLVTVLAASLARADFATLVIDELYSNADGSVQYVVLHEAQGTNGANLLTGHTLSATHAGVTKVFTFPTDLPSATTANSRVLIGSNGFAALRAIAPDYQMPDRFLPTDGGTVNYAGVDQIAYATLPVDGNNALHRSGTVA